MPRSDSPVPGKCPWLRTVLLPAEDCEGPFHTGCTLIQGFDEQMQQVDQVRAIAASDIVIVIYAMDQARLIAGDLPLKKNTL